MNRTLIVIPTYNEAANLEPLVASLRAHATDADILIVDDASPDGTGEIADRLAADPSVHVLHRPGKEGLGVAYGSGFAWGLERPEYEWFVEMDADGSHRPAELRRLRNAAYRADLVIGSRWIPGGRVLDWPRTRQLISKAGTAYARLMLGLPVRDATAGFRVLSRRALEAASLATVASHGYCFQIDMTRRIHAAGLPILEVPVTFVERQHGASKMTTGIIVEALWRVTLWGIQRLFGRSQSG
ncbi:MAG TPA: polyprenol monophosphomannose synthase [Aeromicrobium sp.]|nr:polyprenol monophosphomannose synthase [Aeromicrobium sp.]HKY56801.1 polyprenol monophosphomannose synthase [Aeromicrobium sp.]